MSKPTIKQLAATSVIVVATSVGLNVADAHVGIHATAGAAIGIGSAAIAGLKDGLKAAKEKEDADKKG
jgi:hypothetical protein